MLGKVRGVKQLHTLFNFTSGVFLVEFFWRFQLKSGAMASDWHVIAVNCDRRLVFCNTLGVIPFDNGLSKESEATHRAVENYFHIRSVNYVWLVGTKNFVR